MNCAQRRPARWNDALLNCPRCGGLVVAVTAAVVGLLAIGTVGVPAVSASAAAAQGARVRLPVGMLGPVASDGGGSGSGSGAAADRAGTATAQAAASRSAVVAPRTPMLGVPVLVGWTAPVPGAWVSEPFGVPDRRYVAGYHTGIDFAADQGTPVLAVGPGTVVTAGRQTGYGNAVSLRLPDGRFAFYAHLSAIEVSVGQRVPGGLRLGLVGSTGNATGPHLHFEIRTSNHYGAVLDPVAYLRGHGVTGY